MAIAGDTQNGAVSGRKETCLTLAVVLELDMERREWKKSTETISLAFFSVSFHKLWGVREKHGEGGQEILATKMLVMQTPLKWATACRNFRGQVHCFLSCQLQQWLLTLVLQAMLPSIPGAESYCFQVYNVLI